MAKMNEALTTRRPAFVDYLVMRHTGPPEDQERRATELRNRFASPQRWVRIKRINRRLFLKRACLVPRKVTMRECQVFRLH